MIFNPLFSNLLMRWRFWQRLKDRKRRLEKEGTEMEDRFYLDEKIPYSHGNELVKERTPDMRVHGVHKLVKEAKENKQLAEFVKKLLRNMYEDESNKDVKIEIVRGLSELKDKDYLGKTLLTENDPEVKRQILIELGKLKIGFYADAISKHVNKNNPQEVEGALTGLALHDKNEIRYARGFLETILNEHPYLDNRVMAAKLLITSGDKSALPYILSKASKEGGEWLKIGKVVLGYAGKEHVPLIESMLKKVRYGSPDYWEIRSKLDKIRGK